MGWVPWVSAGLQTILGVGCVYWLWTLPVQYFAPLRVPYVVDAVVIGDDLRGMYL